MDIEFHPQGGGPIRIFDKDSGMWIGRIDFENGQCLYKGNSMAEFEVPDTTDIYSMTKLITDIEHNYDSNS